MAFFGATPARAADTMQRYNRQLTALQQATYSATTDNLQRYNAATDGRQWLTPVCAASRV
jgi:hypothetical protein